MKRFFEKLAKMNTIVFYCVVLLVEILWKTAVLEVFHSYGITEFSQNTTSFDYMKSHFFLIPVFALFEEIAFRWGPMMWFFGFLRLKGKISSKVEKYGIIIIVLTTSIIFGYLHGNVYNILLQGVGGMLIFMVFLRSFYGGRTTEKLEESKGAELLMFKPLMSSTIYHTLFNVTVLVLNL